MPIDGAAEVSERIAKGCQAWRQGDDPEGVGFFQEACQAWLVWLDRLPAEALPQEFANTMTLYLQGLTACLHTQDIARAADILEYKILPGLESFAEGGQDIK